jgi:hypothetical protein
MSYSDLIFQGGEEGACCCEQLPVTIVNTSNVKLQKLKTTVDLMKNLNIDKQKQIKEIEQEAKFVAKEKVKEAKKLAIRLEKDAKYAAKELHKAQKKELARILNEDAEIINYRKLCERLTNPTIVSSREHKSRDMSVFPIGLHIRHCISLNDDKWVGVVSRDDKGKPIILRNGIPYKSPSAFGKAHHRTDPAHPFSTSSGWAECKYEDSKGKWTSVASFRK